MSDSVYTNVLAKVKILGVFQGTRKPVVSADPNPEVEESKILFTMDDQLYTGWLYESPVDDPCECDTGDKFREIRDVEPLDLPPLHIISTE